MKAGTKEILKHGVIGGLAAGAVLAVLFYFYDLGQGEPLRTPAFLFGALIGRNGLEPTFGVVAAYTAIHFLVWAGLGALAAVVIEWADLPRNILIGAAYGLFACSLVFYGGLVVTGAEVLRAPAWPAVFFGNAIAGMVMFTYFHAVSREPGVVGLFNFLEAHPVARDGLVAGLLGAVAVAVWFLLVDLALREPFYTPAALGTLLFRGGGGPEAVSIQPGVVLGYTAVHFAAFLLFSVVLAGLVNQVEQFPPLVFGLLILFVVFELFFIVFVAVLGRWILEELAWWSILLGNLLAAVTMLGYLWKRHPALRGALRDEELWAD